MCVYEYILVFIYMYVFSQYLKPRSMKYYIIKYYINFFLLYCIFYPYPNVEEMVFRIFTYLDLHMMLMVDG